MMDRLQFWLIAESYFSLACETRKSESRRRQIHATSADDAEPFGGSQWMLPLNKTGSGSISILRSEGLAVNSPVRKGGVNATVSI